MSSFLPSRTGRFRTAASAALDEHLTQAITETSPPPLPAAPATGASEMTNPASAGLSVKQLMEDHTRMMGEIQQAQVELLRATLAKQRDAVANAVGNVAAKIEGQTEDFLAIMGQFTNDLGG